MSQQGGRPTGREDDWWGQLYDDSTTDTGPTAAPDSLDDRFASAAGTVGRRPVADDPPEREARDAPPPPPAVPPQRNRPEDVAPSRPPGAYGGRVRAPWEPPPAAPPGPVTFPPGPMPPGFEERAARRAPGPGGPTPPVPTSAPSVGPGRAEPGPVAPVGRRAYVGSGPPTYDAEPTALPAADPDELDDLVPDTVLDGARYGVCTLRAVSVRGDSARFRGEPRRDALLVARFGSGEHALVLVAMATGARATPGAHRAAAEVCQWIGRAVGRSHARLVEDLRAARRGDLKSGLHRLTDRSLGKLRATAAEQGLAPEEYAATLRCLLLPADPACRTRVFFGAGTGGLFRLRGGQWQDLEPEVTETPAGEAVVGFGSPPAETPEGTGSPWTSASPPRRAPTNPRPSRPASPSGSVPRSPDRVMCC